MTRKAPFKWVKPLRPFTFICKYTPGNFQGFTKITLPA